MIRLYPDKEKLFKEVSRGDLGSLTELLEGERPGLYDYLLRMTGQVSRSLETTDEVFQTLTGETLGTFEAYPDLKLCLYVTARRFNADIWNADTAKLANAAVDEQQPSGLLDRALRVLPGPEREAVLLRVRAGFDAAESSEIMGLGEHEVEARLGTGRRRFQAECAAGVEALAELPHHPLPTRSSQATIDLSMVMQGIQTQPVGLRSPLKLALLGIAAAVITTCLLYPGLLQRALDSLRGLPAAASAAKHAPPVPPVAPAVAPVPGGPSP